MKTKQEKISEKSHRPKQRYFILPNGMVQCGEDADSFPN
jgi:hypothetical protein